MYKLNKKNIINYSIFLAIFLIILSTIIDSFNFKILINFFLMYIIIFWLTKDVYKSGLISFTITTIYYMTNVEYYENFENKDLNVEKLVKELSNISNTINTDDDVENNNDNADNIDDNADNIDDIKFDDIDDNDAPSLDSDNEFIKSTKAQKETFRLINTIKQLNHTVNNLAPALKQGANIIDKFKKLNLIAD